MCSYFVYGGYEFDGCLILLFDFDEICVYVEDMKVYGICLVVIFLVFSFVNYDFEVCVVEIVVEVFGEDVVILLLYEIGWIGLLECENVMIINVVLWEFVFEIVDGFILVVCV